MPQNVALLLSLSHVCCTVWDAAAAVAGGQTDDLCSISRPRAGNSQDKWLL